MCPEIAPNLFRRDDDEGFSYIYKQPETKEEEKLALEAIEACPTESIGDDLEKQ
jgi:ferredoxin